MIYIPDPIEIMQSNIERSQDQYIDEHTCMGCKKKVNYGLICPDPMGMGPALCAECAGMPEDW